MGLIEAIAHRPLRQQGENLPAEVSQWSERQRGELMVRLTTWWEETRELDAAGAALWKLDEEHHVVQVQVLNGLLRGGHARAVIEYLEPRFRKGNELWRDFPTLLLRAGSRAPLDIVAQQASVNLMLSQDKVQLIAEYGDDRDFQQLARYVKRVAERSPANTPSHMKAVVDGLRKTRDHRAVPVLVAVLEWEVSRLGGDGAAALVPLYVDEAVKLLEAWSGVPFGHRQVDSPARRLRAVGEVLRWWESGGRSAYALAYNPRHGSGGLR
jgi:hypothetical protein